ncbi:hypothetical protein HH800_05195 [Sphingobium yanoikuyae]|uniref:DUF4145 domain-containing protein n=1 Tax=Sphingobium yanoikuyae TaxID=13690 RepID=A0A6M4G4V6_SPHYA|nr:hypothetical protein [Sphingobium yanoikuyae]QJR01644.1 hypothetical protein HH800_05195 [Sphingobium yanoikuyae]
MDWMQFVAALIASAAWPVAIGSIAYCQRVPIGKFIDRIKSAEAFGAKVRMDVSEDIEEARETIQERGRADYIPLEVERPMSANHGAVEAQHVFRESYLSKIPQALSTTSASGSIVASWLKLEEALKLVCSRGGITWKSFPEKAAKEAAEQGAIDLTTFAVIQKLRRIRNDVVHGRAEVSLEDAASYRATVDSVMKNLEGPAVEHA